MLSGKYFGTGKVRLTTCQRSRSKLYRVLLRGGKNVILMKEGIISYELPTFMCWHFWAVAEIEIDTLVRQAVMLYGISLEPSSNCLIPSVVRDSSNTCCCLNLSWQCFHTKIWNYLEEMIPFVPHVICIYKK